MGDLKRLILLIVGLPLIKGQNSPPEFGPGQKDALIARLANVREDENGGAILFAQPLTCTDPDRDTVAISLEGSDYVSLDFFKRVILNAELDREVFTKDENKRSVKIICEDSQGQQDIIEAKLVLIDVNDNPPRFKKDENDAYRVIIREDTPPGTMIYSDIRVTDIDGPKYNRIRAVCEAECDVFSVSSHLVVGGNAGEYTFNITTLRDVRGKEDYTMKISAVDIPPVGEENDAQASPGAQNVLINIQDIQDQPPEFATKPLSFSIKENQIANSQVGLKFIGAYDNDKRDPNDIELELYAYEGDDTFDNGILELGEISKNDKNIWQAPLMLRKQVDREAIQDLAKILRVNVLAREVAPEGTDPATRNPMSVNDTLEVLVLDDNDEKPTFNQDVYDIYFPEREQVTDESSFYPLSSNGSLEISIKDKDGTQFNQFNISISSGNEQDLFQLNRYRGQNEAQLTISARQNILDYEIPVNRLRILQLYAEDVKDPRLNSFATLRIHLLDINDNAPQFDRPTYTFPINEGVYNGEIIGSVSANDRDSGLFGEIGEYRFTGRNLDANGLFSIDENGDIRAYGTLDYETEPTFSLIVTAFDKGVGDNQMSTDVSVEIVLNNVVDIGPQFNRDRYETFATEGNTDLLPAIRVVAEDPEQSGDIIYSVLSTEPQLLGYFDIPDPTIGRLVLLRPIDFKDTIIDDRNRGVIKVKVQACTTADAQSLCAVTTVVVTISDLNNYSPEFQPSNVYTASVSELALPGLVVTKVSTIDNDALTDPKSDNAKVTYRITQGAGDAFSIREDNGEIIVTGKVKLDFDQHSTYEIEVTARDEGDTIKESIATVAARDKGDPVKESFATVYIDIIDANNKPPSFPDATYFLLVKEDINIGEAITPAVTATDPDKDNRLEYSLDFSGLYVELRGERVDSPVSTQAARAALTVDVNTGMLRTRTALDRSKYERVNFGIIAKDVNIDNTTQPIQTGTASIILTVLGIAEQTPYFEAPVGWTRAVPSVRLQVSESTLNQWDLCSIRAVDPKFQRDINTYEKVEASDFEGYFIVNSTNRVVIVRKEIDYEAIRTKQLSVTVRAIADDGIRFVDATLIVDIVDINDNVPKFTSDRYEMQVSENSKYPTEIGTVVAFDADSGSFGDVKYSLSGLNSEHFSIYTSQSRATVYVSKDAELDYETIRTYTLDVTATDDPNSEVENNKGRAVISIQVIDENDNKPIFKKDIYRFSIVGNRLRGEEVGYVLAEDKDIGNNGKVSYSIENPSQDALKYFDMETTLQGSLVMGRVFVASNLLQNLTRDDVVFSFTVVATDRGTDVVQRGTASVIITVTKGTRDPNPKWDAFIVSTVQVPENCKYGYSVAYITATPGKNSSGVTYSFLGARDSLGTIYQEFSIDTYTGHITVIGDIDYEEKTTYDLLIKATDTSNSSFTNQHLLTVVIIDLNDNIPQFNSCANIVYDPIPVKATVNEAAEIPAFVFAAIACDRDSFPHNIVRYRWFYDAEYCLQDNMDLFELDQLSGRIYTKELLDRETKDRHLLCVEAFTPARKKRDAEVDAIRSRTNHDTVLYVMVEVEDANDQGPKFVNKSDVKIIMEYPRLNVAEAEAIDIDNAPNNEIRYTIDSITFHKGGKTSQASQAFTINSKDGTITKAASEYIDYVGGYFLIDVRAADANGDHNLTDTMTIKVYVGHSSQQVRVVYNEPADISVAEKARNMVSELNDKDEIGVYYEIESIGPHIVSLGAEDEQYDKTDVCMLVVRNDHVMAYVDSAKRFTDVQTVNQIINKYGAVEPGPCSPARSVYPVGWESYWWVLVAFAIFIFVITFILIIMVVFLYNSYKNYMDSQRTYLVTK